jgi:hypothetical protein
MGALRRFALRLLNALRPDRAEPDLARIVGQTVRVQRVLVTTTNLDEPPRR